MARLAALILWLALWLLASVLFQLEESLLPDFFDTGAAFFRLVLDPNFLLDVCITVGRVLPGIALATLIGIPIGLSIAQFLLPRLLLEPFFAFFRGVPVATLFPVVIILFGIGETARLVLTLYVTLPIVVVATAGGAMERPENKTRRDYLRIHREQVEWWHLPLCMLWDALPSVLSGLKIAIALSLVVIIVSEMFFVGGSGAGWYIWDQYQSFNLANMYASIMVVGCTSFGLSKCIDLLGARIHRQ